MKVKLHIKPIILLLILNCLSAFDSKYIEIIQELEANRITKNEEDQALRNAMLIFANEISQQPKQRGFLNNFASVGRALSPALQTYDAELLPLPKASTLPNPINNDISTGEKACKKFGQKFQGCCSHHQGVAGCYDYHVFCNDRTISRTCRCFVRYCVAY